jgi:hypothetical protein
VWITLHHGKYANKVLPLGIIKLNAEYKKITERERQPLQQKLRVPRLRTDTRDPQSPS